MPIGDPQTPAKPREAPSRRPARAAAFALATVATLATDPGPARAEPTTLTLEGPLPDLPEGVRHLHLPFEVPEGTVEIEVAHDDLSEENILDWGLDGPEGFRGWGGGNTENAVVGLDAASRSYLPGPIAPGTWHVVVGVAKVVAPPAQYRVEITLRDVPTLEPETHRAPYAPAAALSEGPRWYAGDFHVHSRESGDAEPTLDEIADFARGRGLDFVMISDHNTTSQLTLYADAQARHPDVLFVPGAEVTTYAGHFNALGATQFIEHRIGLPGTAIEAAVADVHANGGLVSINHPALALGDACIGCAWDHDLPAGVIDAVEIGTGDILKPGGFFSDRAVAFWDALCDAGGRPAAVGGSDDHSGGQAAGALDSPIGSPTTLVFAETLSVDALLAGVRAGDTVVKLHGPDDPMVDFRAPPPDAPRTLGAVITGGRGFTARFVRDGVPGPDVEIDADPFTLSATDDAAAGTEARWRVEVRQGGKRRTVTSHRYIVAADAPAEPPADAASPRADAAAARDARVDAPHSDATTHTTDDAADPGADTGGHGGTGGCAFAGGRSAGGAGAIGALLPGLLGVLGVLGGRRRSRPYAPRPRSVSNRPTP